jgi:5'(3')-deoxyribonucleotidase
MTKPPQRVIAVDCDDVLVDTTPNVIAYYNKTYGAHLELKDMYSHDLAVWQVDSDEEAIIRIEKYLKTREYQRIAPFQETIASIKKLSQKHELHVVTGRSEFLSIATQTMLDTYFPGIFASIEFTGMFGERVRSKGDVCAQIGADLLIDDHLVHAERVAEKGIDVLLFGDYPWNRREFSSKHITRVRDWLEVERILL